VTSTSFKKIIGLEDGAFDRGLRAHRRRLLDRAGVLVMCIGVAFAVIALLGGDVGELETGDCIGAGSVFVAAGGLFLSLGDTS
jgi:hypothetical protein